MTQVYMLVDANNNAFRKNGSEVRYYEEATAKRMRTRLIRNGSLDPRFQVKTAEQYHKDDVDVEVISLMSGKPVMIPKSSKGTASDPSQERYWSA